MFRVVQNNRMNLRRIIQAKPDPPARWPLSPTIPLPRLNFNRLTSPNHPFSPTSQRAERATR